MSEASKVIERDRRVIPNLTRAPYPLVVERAEGSYIWDRDGRKYLDFASGIAVAAVGHSHPRVKEAVKNQLEKASHAAFADFYAEVPVALAERLCHITGYGKVFFSNSGTEAVEAAIKLARFRTKRGKLVAFYGAFHGRTYGSLSLTSSKLVHKTHLGPLLPEVYHTPYADCYRCPFGQEYPCDTECVAFMEEILFRRECNPEEVAAVVTEPIQGEGGIIVPPPEFHKKVKRLCKVHGMLLVDDEVQVGMGRTGRFLGMEHWAVRPDIVCLAKALGGGLPLGATLASEEVFRWEPGTHANTFGGNLLASAAGLAVLDIIEERGLMRRAEKMGLEAMARLGEMAGDIEFLDHVRGKGLFVGIEVVKDKGTREGDRELRDRILKGCFGEGLVLLGAGSSAIRFIPPLTIEEGGLEEGLTRFEKVARSLRS